jgi:hypothetical protein
MEKSKKCRQPTVAHASRTLEEARLPKRPQQGKVKLTRLLFQKWYCHIQQRQKPLAASPLNTLSFIVQLDDMVTTYIPLARFVLRSHEKSALSSCKFA